MGSVGSSNRTLRTSVLNDISGYTGYARELAKVVQGNVVYQLSYNNNKAFADAYINSEGELRIDYIGSTGKGAGSELLARLAEQALTENRPLTWMADRIQSKEYYEHIGVPIDTQATRKYGSTQYTVNPNELPNLIRRLRKNNANNNS